MKREFTQKVKITPSWAAEFSDASSNLSDLPPVGAIAPSGNRYRRTSAAMVGLAISMGGTSLLLPQGDNAMAAEPVGAPTFAPQTAAPEMTNASTQSSVEPEVLSESPAPASAPVLEHQVQPGENLWKLSQAYAIAPEAIAASNDIDRRSVLSVGQTLRIPSVNGIVHQVTDGETVDTLSRSYGVEPTQLSPRNSVLLASAQLPQGEAITVPGNVNTLLKARQEESLNRLKAKGDRLNNSLAELRSEESPNPFKQTLVPTVPLVVAVPNPSSANQAEPTRNSAPEKSFVASSPVVSPRIAVSPNRFPQAPVIIPVPTPETSVPASVPPKLSAPGSVSATIPTSPVIGTGAAAFPTPTSIPVPTPEVAVTPSKNEVEAVRLSAPTSIPVPTPEVAVTPSKNEVEAVRLPAPTSIPVPSLEAATTTPIKNDIGVPSLPTAEATVIPVVTPPALNLGRNPLVASVPTKTLYQVRRGDTLNAIARRYGVSPSELIRANGIDNPNQIRVNQRLTIPAELSTGSDNQTVAVLPALNPNKSDSGVGRYESSVIDPSPIASNSENGFSDNDRSQSSPYVDRLRADVVRMRDRYRNGQVIQSDSVVVPTAPVVIPTTPNANSLLPPNIGNQSLNSNRQPDTLRTWQRPQQRQQNFQAIQIPVPPAPQTRGLVATAPAGSETYNPALRLPVGETVSPSFPSNQSPEYFPGTPSQITGYIWPTRGTLTSGYGRRWGRMHRGIDIAAPVGTPVMAAAPGVVVSAGWNSGGYGNLVEIRHSDGCITRYAHNNRILVSRGQIVEQGQQISEMGSTGRSTGPHLHFEVHPTGQGAVNPVAYLPRSRS